MRSLETGLAGWGGDRAEPVLTAAELDRSLRTPSPERILTVRAAMVAGRTDQQIHDLSRIDPWFLSKLRVLINTETELLNDRQLSEISAAGFFRLKQLGYSDRQIAWFTGSDQLDVREARLKLGVRPVFKTVDTCAAEFASTTPYHLSLIHI